ncbi:antirestriction protein ArdA [Chryseobacterium camelliae]|uniref:Antirestriction protein ArdA n=1 Tax=Chryseobacterium camelliae TaxID=1265445 RepID=A0ABY7QPV4_9FLAO|nr:antirestriction protein ArdA [Chryseobacterium camelliae]WBV61670.1 antirestriction protein ArdA [Chryseobacterium camelliae]
MPRSIGVLLGESINFKSRLKLINMTNLRNCLDTVSIYVSTYAKYNNSSLYGKWLNLGDYSDYDELLEVMRELHKDESDPEFMISDYEGCELFVKLGLISECHLSSEIYEIALQIYDSGHDIEVFIACIDCLGKMDFQSIYEYVNNFYYGEYSSDEDFVQWLYEDDTFNIPNWVVIDWSATARSIMFDYFESNGHYFRS